MMDLGDWLRSLGLERYEAAFRDNEIDEAVLLNLTAEDLKELGVAALGHRRKLIDAIAALRSKANANASAATASADDVAVEASLRDMAERRQVTVMFADLVGSTALAARMDPEDLREIISAYQNCVAETVARCGGFVAKYMGDGVLVYFGYPQAHEDDAERAVRAGLELVAGVAALKTRAALQTRIGIATGLVVVGDLIGTGSAQEQTVVGETPNLAARLQSIAEPNTVVIAESTRKLIGNLFELEDLGAKELKGIAGPVRAFAALRASAVESRFEALRTATIPLVGRSEEIELLMRRWAQAKAGEGCVALISGEPGIGKSRLVQTMVERLAGEPHTRLRYFCSPHHQDSALYPVIAQIERAAGFRREDTPGERLDKLEAVLAQGTNDLGEAVTLLAELLAIPTGERYPALDLTPQKRKEKTLAVLGAQVEGLSARGPLLMVYEDVHWSDPTTRESLDLLIERVPTLPVLVILTFRPEFAPPWVGRPQVTLLSLNRLPPRQRAEMIAHVTGGKALPREIAEQIAERTDGVPLFIEELTKSVVESGLVAQAGDGYAAAGPAAPLAIPTTLHASLLSRLDRLAPTREVAQIGAALGRSFSHELISAVAQMPRPRLDEALEQLVGAELIFRRGRPPDAEYTFKHALVQDAAYSTLLRSRRQQIHGQIVMSLESQFPDLVAAQPALMAHHCNEAGLTEKAIGYWLKAGQQSVTRSAMTEAVAQLQKGLALAASQPDTPTRRQQELDLRVALGPALSATRGYSSSEVGENLARATSLAEETGGTDYLAPLFYGQVVYHAVRAEYRIALSLAERLEQIGAARNDAVALLEGHYLNGFVRRHIGEFAAAHSVLQQCHGLRDPAVRQTLSKLTSEDLYAGSLALSAVVLAVLGHFAQARLQLSQALLEARQLGHHNALAYTLCLANGVEMTLTGSSVEVGQHNSELIALCEKHGLTYWLCWGLILRSSWLTAVGQANEALEMFSNAIPLLESTGSRISRPTYLAGLAMAHARAGCPAEGLGRLQEAAQFIESTDERHYEAEVYRLQGDLLRAAGDQEAAERSYRRALAVAGRQQAKTYELGAATGLARLWRDQGKRDEARELLAPVYGWFTEGFDTPVLQNAKALLDELAS